MGRPTIRELEERLKLKDGENEKLRRNIRLKDSELRELQDKCNFKSDRVVELERKYGEASSEVEQLKSIVESRFPDEVEDGLLEKTLMCAEATNQVDRLQEKLKKTKKENTELREERNSLKNKCQALSHKLHKAISSNEVLKKESDMHNKVFLELDDIVTALNNIRIDSDFTVEDENDNVSMQNMKRKIQAIERDRQRLAKDCKNLQEENAFKDVKIQSLESKYYDPKKSSKEPTQPSPFRSRRTTTIEVDDRSESSSDSSTIEPPHVSLEVYEETKREYESALRDMIQLTEELNATKASLKGYEKSSNETEERFNELSEEYKDALLEMSNLRRDYQKTEAKYNKAIIDYDEMKHEYETRVTEMTEAYEFLEESYNTLKDDQNQKLVRLESEVSNSERCFEEECKRLKEEHALKIRSLSREVDELKEDQEKKIGIERRKYEDLKIDFESVNDQLRGKRDELERLKDKYDKSLKRIVHLEDSIKREKENNERALLRSSEDALRKYQKLKTDYNALVAARKSSGNSESKYVRQLEDQCLMLQKKVRHAHTDAETRYKELQSSYESALATIDTLEKKLAEMEERPAELHQKQKEKKPKSRYEMAFDEIAVLERKLMSGEGSMEPLNVATKENGSLSKSTTVVNKSSSGYTTSTIFENGDLMVSSIFISLAWPRTAFGPHSYHCFSQNGGLDHFWDFLQHQRKLKLVHRKLLTRATLSEERLDLQSSPSFFGSMFLDENLDIKYFKESTSANVDSNSKRTISKLLDQLAKMKLQAAAARIRYQAHEKEFKLVFLKYKMIRKEYNATLAESSKPKVGKSVSAAPNKQTAVVKETKSTITNRGLPADPPGEAVILGVEDETDTADHPANSPLHERAQGEATIATKIAQLEVSLRAAEKKVEQATVMINDTREKAEEAEREQQEQERNLRNTLAQHKELLQAEMMASVNRKEIASTNVEKDQGHSNPEASFDVGSVMASSCGSSISAEARDEKTHSPKRQQQKTLNQGTTTGYIQLKQSYDAAVHKISTIEYELRQKQQESDISKEKLKAREEELKDVIKRYKELHTEYGGFLDGSSSVSHAKVMQERDAAKWRISEMEIELRRAKEAAASASAKQNLAKQHLRDLIFQYKTLQREHASLVQRIESLKIGLPPIRPPPSRRANQERRVQIQEEKRDSDIPVSTDTSVQDHVSRDGRSEASQQHAPVDDTQSITSNSTRRSHSSKSSKKKGFVKEIYKEVKLNLKRKTAGPRAKVKEVKRIQGL
eukprot:scaffold543_cov119-Cylindrotheca_fusiformis.AAC.22